MQAKFQDQLFALVINLDRDKKKLEQVRALLRALGLTWKRLKAIDGRKLLLAGGRSRLVKPLNYRLCYNEEKCRVQHVIRPGKLARSGALDIWSQHACARSHRAALERVLFSFTSKRKYILVLEDDIVLANGVTCAQFWSRLRKVIRYLNKNHQNWVALLLGAVPLLCEAGGNKQTGLANLYSARRAVQAHAIVFNNNTDTQACIDTVQSKISKGMVADNAMAAAMKVFQDAFYYLHPSLLIQNQDCTSALQLVGNSGGHKGYQQALRKSASMTKMHVARTARSNLPSKIVSALGPKRRGVKPIVKKSLKEVRKRIGSCGGKASAGGGSTVEMVNSKMKALLAYVRKSKTFPSRRMAEEKFQVSRTVWAKLKQKHMS